MDRSQSTLLAALSALVALVAVLLFLGGDRSEDDDPEATAAIWNLDAENVQEIRIEREAGVVRLEREGGSWRLRAPYDEPADPGRVDDLLDTLHRVRNGIPVDVPPEQAADFGLGDPPQARVTLGFGGGEEETIEVGFEAPTGYRTYVRDASGGIAAVNGDLNRPLQVEAERYRNPTVLSFEPADVGGITIPGAPAAQLTRRGGRWWIDGIGPADPTAVSDLLQAVRELQFDQYGGDLGIAAEWVLSFADREALRLAVGALTDEGVVVRGPDGRIGTVDPESIAMLPRRAEDLLAVSAFALALDASDRVTLEREGQTFTAIRNGSAWQTAGVDDGAVWTWVSALARARAIARPPVAPDPVEMVVMVDDQRTEIGPARPEGYRMARDAGTGDLFAVEAAPVDDAWTGARATTSEETAGSSPPD